MPADPSYSAFGPRPLPPIRHARLECALAVLAATAEAVRMDAKLRARSNPDEPVESAMAEALALDRAAMVLRGEALPAEDGAPAGPVAHRCEFPGCDERASYHFAIGSEPGHWACGGHKVEIEDLWQVERAERLAKAAALLEKEPDNNLAGIGDRLI